MHPYLMYQLIKARQAELEHRAEHYRTAQAGRSRRARRGSRLRAVDGGAGRPPVFGARTARGNGQPVPPRWDGPAEPAGGPPRTAHRAAERDRVPAGKGT
jgi:hypothetical protein